MMDRLRDQRSATDPVLARAARLARAVAPSAPPVGLEQRVRARLLHGRKRRRVRRLGPVSTVLLVFIAGTAAAAAGTAIRAAWVWRSQSVAARRAEPAPMGRPGARRAAKVSVVQPVETIPNEEIVAVPAVQPAATGEVPGSPRIASSVPATPNPAPFARQPAARTRRADAPTHASDTVAAARAAAASRATSARRPDDHAAANPAARPDASRHSPIDTEAALVVEATRALHADGDARSALGLLDKYLQRYPEGDLIEESLALEIEAMSRLDDPEAARLAGDYLRRFPAGRFRKVALDALRRFGK